MKPKPTPDSLRCAFEGTLGPADWAVVHWFQLASTGIGTIADLNNLVDQIGDAYAAAFVTVGGVSTNLHFTRVRASYRTQDGAGRLRTVTIADETGTGSGTDAPAQCAYLIDWQSIDDRRGGKPRSYIPGVVLGSMADEARIDAATVASLSAGAVAYIAATFALSHGPLVAPKLVEMSFRTGNADRVAAVTFDILSGVCSGVVATQRRRVDRLRT